jgi:hypothetical protein
VVFGKITGISKKKCGENRLDLIGLQEAKKQDYSTTLFRTIDPANDFFGSGLFLLVNLEVFWWV